MNNQEEIQINGQEEEYEGDRIQDYSSPSYRARSLSKNKRTNGYIEEMNHEKGIQSICVLGLNHIASMSCDKQIKIWNYSKSEAIFQYQNGCTSCNNILKIGFCHYLSISGDHGQQLQLIEWNEMKIIQKLNTDEKIIYLEASPQIASDHTIICGDIKGSLLILNIDMNVLQHPQNNQLYQPLKLVRKIKNKDNSIAMQSVSSICFLEDTNKVAVGGDKGSIYFYNLSKSKIYKHIPKAHINGRKVSLIAQFYKNDKQYIVSGGCDQFIRLFEEETLTVLKQVSVNNPIVCGIQIDNEFAAIGEGRHVLLIGLQNLSTHSLMLHKARVNVISLDKDKSNIVIGDINGTLKVWSLMRDFKSGSGELSQQSSTHFRSSRQMEYPSTVRKSNKFEEMNGQISTQRNEYSSYSNTNRYDSNTQRYIKNLLKSQEKKRDDSNNRLILRESSSSKLSASNGKFSNQKQQSYIVQNQSIDYNAISTDKKTPIIGQNPSIVSNYSMSGQSNKFLRNSSTIKSSSGKKITNFIVPLQAQNQNKIDSKSLQGSFQIRKEQPISENNYTILINGEQRANYESLVNVQSVNNNEIIQNNHSDNSSNRLLQNLIQRTYLDDIQQIESQPISQHQTNQMNTNQHSLEAIQQSYQPQSSHSQQETLYERNTNLHQGDQELQSEREQVEENFYYHLIKQQANQNYLEKGYMNPQTPSQSINQYRSDEENLIRNLHFDQHQSNQFFQRQIPQNQNQNQLDKTGKQAMCDPYDMNEYDEKLKEKLDIEQRELRNQIKQQETEFRNSILRAQSSKSLSSSIQEKSSSLIDPATIAGVTATYSVASQHFSNIPQQQQMSEEDHLQSPNLENLVATKQTTLIETQNDNVISQAEFKQLLNQIKIESEQNNNQNSVDQNQEMKYYEDNQQENNSQLNDTNQLIVERRNYDTLTNQNQLKQSYDDFKKRLLLLEEQQLLNHQQISEIREISTMNFDENMKIKSELEEIKTKLVEINKPKRIKRNIYSLSQQRRSSLKEMKEKKQQQTNQYMSPYRQQGRVINSFLVSEKRINSNENRLNTDLNQEIEENQMKKSLRQQINETIMCYKQAQQSMRSSQKLTTQKFQSPSKIQVSQVESPQKNYVEMNKAYVSPLKVNWKYINDPEFSEQIKCSQLNNKMRSLSTDFLGIRKSRESQAKQEEKEQIDPMERKLNFDYNDRISHNRGNSLNSNIRNKQNFNRCQIIDQQHINRVNTSIFDTTNQSNSMKEEEFNKHFQNISAIEGEKQIQKNNQFFTTMNSQQTNQLNQISEQSQLIQTNEIKAQFQNTHQFQEPFQQTSKQQNQNTSLNDSKKYSYRQLQNITKGSEISQDKKIFPDNQTNPSNKFINKEPKFINKNYIYNPQNYKIKNLGLGHGKEQQGSYQNQQNPYLISVNGNLNQNEKEQLQCMRKIVEERDDNMDTLQNVSQSLNQPLSSFLTNVQTNQTKNNFATQQQNEQALNPQNAEKDIKPTLFNEEEKEKYQEQKRREFMIIQNSQNLSNQVQKEFNECIQGMKDCLAQNKNDLEILKNEIKGMDQRRRNSKGKVQDHYSSALNFIQEQNQIDWENSQRTFSSRKK